VRRNDRFEAGSERRTYSIPNRFVSFRFALFSFFLVFAELSLYVSTYLFAVLVPVSGVVPEYRNFGLYRALLEPLGAWCGAALRISAAAEGWHEHPWAIGTWVAD
jgi:hypothetical protein